MQVGSELLRAVTYLATCVEGLDERRSKRGPPSLMRGTQTAPRVAIEVLAEEDQVFPIRVSCVTFFSSVAGAVAILVGAGETHQASCNILSNLDEGPLLAAAGGVLKLEVIAIDERIALQCVDQQHVHGKPYGAAPVTVAAEHPAISLRRRVTYAEVLSGKLYFERIL